ncbi:MAG: MBOAT family O-acyltransferase [Halioglobus sp.]|nr:MBOAT family O-acyltransferase [Halioglobus sp.]
MSFTSFGFLLLYLLAMVVRWLPLSRDVQWPSFRVIAVLVLSWLFYAWHVPWYILLILFSTVVDFIAGLLLGATPQASILRRRLILTFSLTSNLALLGYFKYAGFLFGEVNALTGASWAVPQLILPVGISFYTFQSMSYSIDVYRGAIQAERSFARFACYIAFFPQLVAGPIVRAKEFLYQFQRRRRFHTRVFMEGCYLILRGLFLKLVLADNLGRIVDELWSPAAAEPHGVLALTVLVFFSCQLLCDFAGYVDIARGVAYHLGFRLPVNFNAPYIATSFSGFWHRWHITLSEWMRDYLYKPLGGSRRGQLRTYMNLFAVMMISGLWHGASWTFVLWGVALGLALVCERLLGLSRLQRPLLGLLIWFVVVQLVWIFSMGLFRAESLEQAMGITSNAWVGLIELLSQGYSIEQAADLITYGWWLTLPVWLFHLRTCLAEQTRIGLPAAAERSVYAGVMLAGLLMLYATGQQFIYFQF